MCALAGRGERGRGKWIGKEEARKESAGEGMRQREAKGEEGVEREEREEEERRKRGGSSQSGREEAGNVPGMYVGSPLFGRLESSGSSSFLPSLRCLFALFFFLSPSPFPFLSLSLSFASLPRTVQLAQALLLYYCPTVNFARKAI